MKLFIGIILFFTIKSYAQVTGNFLNVTIEGKITDSLIKNRTDSETVLTVQISKYPFSAANMLGIPYNNYEARLKYNERFKFCIPAPANRFYMVIYYLPGPRQDISWSSFDNVYILDSCDSINITLNKDSFQFSGKGADKLNCQTEIYKKKYNYSNDLIKALNTKNYNGYFDLISRKMDSCLNLQIAIVNKYKAKLGESLSDVMLANCYGLRYYEPLRGHRQVLNTDSHLYNSLINSGAYKSINFNIDKKIKAELLVQSPIYVDFLFEKIRIDCFSEKDGVVQLPKSMARIFNIIKSNYYGLVRDKLLALFFITYSSVPSSLTYLEEGIAIVGSAIYRDILLNIKNTRYKDLLFFPFELPTVSGENVKLSDFNNKVVILDFWYTGCLNCANLKKAMTKIHTKYKNNPSVVFMSISIDKDKLKWMKSVSSGLYANPLDVNLYTTGLGDQHPLIKYYSIIGYPTMFIIRSGTMFNSNPPHPSGDSIDDVGTKELIEMIELAINTL